MKLLLEAIMEQIADLENFFLAEEPERNCDATDNASLADMVEAGLALGSTEAFCRPRFPTFHRCKISCAPAHASRGEESIPDKLLQIAIGRCA